MIQKAVAVLSVLLLPLSVGFGQVPAGSSPSAPAQQAVPLLSPDQLNNLVAPVALYPDPLLSQVLAASTYPLEIVEVQQWRQQNRNLQGAALLDAAKQQNWDPSVQALVAFPDVLNLLGNDIRWTTDLGNAFLAQQADVMSAVQRMRASAEANGRLKSTPQQVVTTDTQYGQSAIEIQPANPQVIYVPVYQPEYVWGPPAWGAYPDLWYPSGFGYGFGFGFAPGIFIGGLFPGWAGWGGWGWGCGWFGRGLFINTGFFNRYGFRGGFGHGFGDRGFGGRTAWAHDPGHRMGVPYSNRTVATRYGSSSFASGGRFAGGHSYAQSNRSFANGRANGWGSINGGNRAATSGFASSSRQTSPNYGARSASPAYRGPAQSYRGNTFGYGGGASHNQSFVPARSQNYSAARSYSTPRQSFSARSFSGGGAHFSAGHSNFSGGHGGGRSFGGGGGHSSGGHSGGGHHR